MRACVGESKRERYCCTVCPQFLCISCLGNDNPNKEACRDEGTHTRSHVDCMSN